MRGAAGVAGIVAIAMGACSRAAPAGKGEDAAAKALACEVSGCASMTRDGTCEIPDDGAVHVWLEAPGARFDVDGRAIDATRSRPPSGGELARVVLPREARVLRARTENGATWTLRLAPPHAKGVFDEFRALRQEGKVDEATAVAERAVDAGGAGRSEGLRALGRIELARGNTERSEQLLGEAIAEERARGALSEAADDSCTLAYALARSDHRYTEARAALDAIEPELGPYVDGRARVTYQRGVIALETGDARGALRFFDESRAIAARIGNTRDERNARSTRALQLERLGRIDEALADVRALFAEATDSPACDRVAYALNVGLGFLLSGDAAAGRSPLDEAASLTQAKCADASDRATVASMQALVDLAEGKVDAARSHAVAAHAALPDPRGSLAQWLVDVDARVALAADDAKAALGLYEREAALAQASADREGEWSGSYGRGEALAKLGRSRDALAAYAHAEAILDDSALAVPLGEGRTTFLAERDRSAIALVDARVRAGDVEAAERAAAHARSRALEGAARAERIAHLTPGDRAKWESALGEYRAARAAMDDAAREDWRLAGDKLEAARRARADLGMRLARSLDDALLVVASRAPKSDGRPALGDRERLVRWFPSRAGYFAFVSDATTTTATRLGAIDPRADRDALAAAMLAPIAPRLRGADRLRLAPWGTLWSVDVHALPFEGAPLVARFAITYALDLAALGAAASPSATALVVVDPSGNLPAARDEGAAIAGELDAGAWSVAVLRGDRATSDAVRAGFAGASLFHYAGHGRFDAADEWSSALPLARGTRLTIADVLALPSSPERVVLSGCNGARTSGASVEGLGLAQAFLAAGSREVIAATRVVDDRVTADTMSALYAALRDDPKADLAAALRAAELAIQARAPAADWSAFRLLRP